MKTLKVLISVLLVFGLSAFTGLELVKWKTKENYIIKCGDATFRGLQAHIIFDEEHPERSKIKATIDATTVNTGNPEKNSHMKAEEVLYTMRHQFITFESTAIKKIEEGYEAMGNLTLKGITKEIKFNFTFSSQNKGNQFPFYDKETFHGFMLLNPKDFNITKGMNPISIELTIPVTR